MSQQKSMSESRRARKFSVMGRADTRIIGIWVTEKDYTSQHFDLSVEVAKRFAVELLEECKNQETRMLDQQGIGFEQPTRELVAVD